MYQVAKEIMQTLLILALAGMSGFLVWRFLNYVADL
jgi:hypothetical protein